MMKRTKQNTVQSDATAPRDENRPWRITAKPPVARTIAHHGLSNPHLVPTLKAILDKLKYDPFQYPTKEGPLDDLRGAPLHFRKVKYRLLFQILKKERVVRLLVLEERKSNRVYKRARRVKDGLTASDVEI